MAQTLNEIYRTFDNQMTELGKRLGRYVLKRRKFRYLKKLAKEDFKRRARRNIKVPNGVKKELAIYGCIFAALAILLILPLDLLIDRPEKHEVKTPIICKEETEEKLPSVDNFIEELEPVSTDDETKMLILAVQHEVGLNPNYYPDEDFDFIQQCMAKSIKNRIGTPGFGNTLSEVLLQKDQYTGLLNDIKNYKALNNSNQYNEHDERTLKNVQIVMNGEDSLPSDLYFERCSEDESTIEEAWENFQKEYSSDELVLYYWFNTSDGRFIMFAENANGAY